MHYICALTHRRIHYWRQRREALVLLLSRERSTATLNCEFVEEALTRMGQAQELFVDGMDQWYRSYLN